MTDEPIERSQDATEYVEQAMAASGYSVTEHPEIFAHLWQAIAALAEIGIGEDRLIPALESVINGLRENRTVLEVVFGVDGTGENR